MFLEVQCDVSFQVQVTYLKEHVTYLMKQVSVGEKEVSLQEIWSWFEFLPGLFGIVLRGGYLYGTWPRTVLIIFEFQFIVPEL